MSERPKKDPIIVGLAVVIAILLSPVIFICWGMYQIIGMDRDYNPSKDAMIEYFNAHRDDFARAAGVLPEQECDYSCDAPDEISVWAGPDAGLYICRENEEPPMFDLHTEGGTFSYIPGQEAVPESWRPCVGVWATCSDRIADHCFAAHGISIDRLLGLERIVDGS